MDDFRMTIGELIDELNKYNDDDVVLNVDIEDYGSDRGDYQDFYVGVADDGEGNCTVGSLVSLLWKVQGESFTGYKGGEFLMDSDTVIRHNNYRCVGEQIIGVERCDEGVYLDTKSY